MIALDPRNVHPGGLACRRLRVKKDPKREGELFLVEINISFANFLRDVRLRDFVTEKDRVEMLFWMLSSV
jgi:hypothetical protein